MNSLASILPQLAIFNQKRCMIHAMKDMKILKKLCMNLELLYVEDDMSVQESMSKYLKKLFSKVAVAPDGAAGLQLYKQKSFHIVITDISMPKMNGLEMLKQIRAINSEQIVLITSAYTNPEYMIESIKMSVDGYIVKPFDYEQLNFELFKITQKIQKFAENEKYKKNLNRMIEQKTSEINSMLHFQKYNHDKTLLSMVEMIEDRDTYTAGHSQRVAHYSKMIAQEMAYSEEECERVYQAGILHDIGKIATPDVILLNPHKLNDLEYKLIQEHVSVGYRLLVNIPMFENLAEIVYAHHEHYDGSGYPRGIKGDEIPALSQIMVVADAFDAMTTNRIYKARKSVAMALDEIKRLSSSWFAPNVVQNALKVLKDIKIDDTINQLPETEVEQERFAYFYKDVLCDAYNENYLDLILVQNSAELKLKYLYIVSLKNFTLFNQNNSWRAGDEVLKSIAKFLHDNFEHEYVFRVYGDDFVILSENIIDEELLQTKLVTLISKELPFRIKKYLVKDIDIDKIEQLINKKV